MAYNYGTTATTHGARATDSYYVLDTNNDPSGGTTIVGDLTVEGSIGSTGVITAGAGLGVVGAVTASGNGTFGGGVSTATVSINSPPGTRALTANGTAVFTRTTDASGVDGYIQIKNFVGSGVGIRADAATGVVGFEPVTANVVGTGGMTLELNGDLTEVGVFTAGRPGGDTTNDGFMSVQNGTGNGIGFRSLATNVAIGGGTIERVAGGVGSGVADISISTGGEATFTYKANAPLFNLSGAGGSNYGLINCTGGGAGTPVANTSVTGNTIIHLTPVIGTILTNPISYTLSTGVGFTIFNFNAGAVDVVFSITALSAST
jgi:hypothetical protein